MMSPGLVSGSTHRRAPELVDDWIPVTSTGMTPLLQKGRFRRNGRQPVLKAGGHRKVWRSNRQPSANTGASDLAIAAPINKQAQILKRQRDLTVNQVPMASQVRVLLCARVRSSMAEPCGATAQTRVRFL